MMRFSRFRALKSKIFNKMKNGNNKTQCNYFAEYVNETTIERCTRAHLRGRKNVCACLVYVSTYICVYVCVRERERMSERNKKNRVIRLSFSEAPSGQRGGL